VGVQGGVGGVFWPGAWCVRLVFGWLLGVVDRFALVAGGRVLQNVCAVSMRLDMGVETWRKCGTV
jgi:hypothetical protein